MNELALEERSIPPRNCAIFQDVGADPADEKVVTEHGWNGDEKADHRCHQSGGDSGGHALDAGAAPGQERLH